ncbi:hypothetical protein KXV85_005240, partial [Aspergillus fumigatus]
RRHRDGLQARGAEAIDRHAGGRLRQAGKQRGLAADVRRAMGAIAEIAVLHIILGDARALDRMLDRMRRKRHRRGDVESATAGLGQTRAGIGNDYGFTHFSLPLAGRLRLISYEFLTDGNKNTVRRQARRAEFFRCQTLVSPSGIFRQRKRQQFRRAKL